MIWALSGDQFDRLLEGDARFADNHIVIASRLVSAHHAVIERKGDEYRIRDLGSSNGTYFNETEISGAALGYVVHR